MENTFEAYKFYARLQLCIRLYKPLETFSMFRVLFDGSFGPKMKQTRYT
jgi:hypothetical protein